MTTTRVTVPVEPTEAMLTAAADAFSAHPSAFPLIYRAMLSAAPAPEGGAVHYNVRTEGAPGITETDRREAPAGSAHPCYDEHQPGCDCVIPPQKAAPAPSFLERMTAPAEAGEPAETGNGPLYDLVDFLRPEFREETKLHLARRTPELLRAQPPAREDAQPVACSACRECGCNFFAHPVPDALREAYVALKEVESALIAGANGWRLRADYSIGSLGRALTSLAALQAEQKGGA